MNPFLLVEALIDKGYELDEVISNLSHTQVNAQKLDMRSKGLEAHYDASGHYIPPAQVVLAAFTMCDDPRDCAAALMEFNLYWTERSEGRAVYPHEQFLKYLANRKTA